MMSTATTRARRSTMTTVIAIGIVATIGVDIAQAASSGSAAHSAAAKHGNVLSAEQAYLKTLAPLALQMHNTVAPVSDVLNAIIEPHHGDSYSARDAVLHGEGPSGVHAIRLELQKLQAPAPLAKDQRELVAAAKQMDGALHGIRQLAAAQGGHLVDAINNFSDGTFATGEDNWENALDDAYAIGHSTTTPPGVIGSHLKAPVSRTAWIFGADRACSASTFRLGDVNALNPDHTVSGATAYNERWKATIAWLNKKIRALPRPKGASALPVGLSSRLKALSYNVTLFTHVIDALKAENFDRFNSALSQLDQIRPSLRVLGTEFNRYGARSCGLVIGMYGGKKLTVPGHGSTVNT